MLSVLTCVRVPVYILAECNLCACIMLDRIHLMIPFRLDAIATSAGARGHEILTVDLEALGVPLVASGVQSDGQGGYTVEDLRHAWESVSTGYTPMAVKVFHESMGKRLMPCVELKASPAKLLQGHNVFGPTSIRAGVEVMCKWLAGSYPKLWALLNWRAAEVYALDCTFSSRLPDERTALQCIQALRGISSGQTRNRGDDYETTAYWGSKDSRLKKIKAYLKAPEFARQLADVQRLARTGDLSARRVYRVMSDQRLQDWAQNLLRLEVTVMHRWMERRQIPTNAWDLCEYQENLLSTDNVCLIAKCWADSMADLIKVCEGQTMRVLDDDSVLDAVRNYVNDKGKRISEQQARAVFSTYRHIRDYGWQETQDSLSKTTFYRHVSIIAECGISRAALQKLHGDRGNNVVPLLRFLQVDFSAQRPSWYVEPSVEAA